MSQIVVVEDDASMSQAIERILSAGGFESRSFTSAEDALESSATTTADCLILDVQLPGISGLEMFERLARNGLRIPTIVMSGHDDPAVRAESERMAVNQYLPKPFTGRALLEAVGRILEPSP